ncbi:hypothetical protein SAMN05216357_105126 [Porphyromonadaceae bacterium KH3CP3RA]|nr:hypothetical protein SAMN05216357_105126 [Porphyromonadaceae bacterium KH3CP3RA]
MSKFKKTFTYLKNNLNFVIKLDVRDKDHFTIVS